MRAKLINLWLTASLSVVVTFSYAQQDQQNQPAAQNQPAPQSPWLSSGDNSQSQQTYPAAGTLPTQPDKSLFLGPSGGRLDYMAATAGGQLPQSPLQGMLAPGYATGGDYCYADTQCIQAFHSNNAIDIRRCLSDYRYSNCPIPAKFFVSYCVANSTKVYTGYDMRCDAYTAMSSPGKSQMIYTIPLIDFGQETSTAIANSILGQNLYLARLQQQAQDIYPPSYNSSRQHGLEAGKNYEDYTEAVNNTTYQMMLNTYGQYQGSGKWDHPTDVKMVGNRLAIYCGLFENTLGLCPPKDDPWKNQRQQLMNRDLLATSLFSDVLAPINNDTGSQSVYPGLDYINNITGMVPENLNVTSGGDKINQYKSLLDFYTRESRLALARDTLASIYHDREISKELAVPEKYTPNTTKGVSVAVPAKSQMLATSRFGLLRFEANKRFDTPSWYDSLNQQSTQSLLKEMANMMALQLKLQFAMYQQNQRIEALLATQLASTSDLSSTAYSQSTQSNQSGGQ